MNLKRLTVAMLAIVEDVRASRIEKIEAARVAAACSGIWMGDTDESLLSTRQAVQLRQARQLIAEKMQRRKERKRLENRRGYLKRKLRQKQDVPQGGIIGTTE
jgi:hypothetical protein